MQTIFFWRRLLSIRGWDLLNFDGKKWGLLFEGGVIQGGIFEALD